MNFTELPEDTLRIILKHSAPTGMYPVYDLSSRRLTEYTWFLVSKKMNKVIADHKRAEMSISDNYADDRFIRCKFELEWLENPFGPGTDRLWLARLGFQ